MRISTSTFYNASLTGIQDQQSQIARLTQRIAEQKSFITAKEAPINASRAMDLSNSIAQRTQYMANQDRAELSLKFENLQLEQLRTTLNSTRTTLMGAGADQTQSVRDQLAIQVSNFYSLARDIANSRDAQGNYVFAGHETASQPYAHTPTYPGSLPVSANATSYAGDSGVRGVAVESGRQVQTSDSIEDVLRGDGSAAQDLLGAIDYAATALQDPAASASAVDAAVQGAISAINGALDSLQNVQTRVAGRMLEVNDLRASTRQLLATEKDALGSLTELDTAAAIIELQLQQTNLEASQRTFALVSNLSLFSYIS